jgi:TonB family protein
MKPTLCRMVCALLLTSPGQLMGEPSVDGQPVAKGDHVQTQTFEPVRIKKSIVPAYTPEASFNYEEGWVELRFMVSPEGKAYQAYVSQSVGRKEFQRAALQAIQDFTFEPALENGRPIDSAASIKMKFELNGGLQGAREVYITGYRAFDRAIAAGNKQAADAALTKLRISNLYEDAYYGLAQYRYAIKWGDEKEQMSGLRRAIASESSAHYLPKTLFVSALRDLFRLEVGAQDFAAAISTWETMLKAGIDQQTRSDLQPVVDQLNVIRADDRAYAIDGQIIESSWEYRLFKSWFHVTVSEGQITGVRLLCDKKYVEFKYDPALDYRVSSRFGQCALVLSGDAGTQFRLIQH